MLARTLLRPQIVWGGVMVASLFLVGMLSFAMSWIPVDAQGLSSAARLSISAVPSRIPADGRDHQALFLRLELPGGVPVRADSDVVVSLASEDPTVVSVPELVTIPEGEMVASVPLTAERTIGAVTIRASADGYSTDVVSVSTVNPFAASPPFSLGLSLGPSIMATSSLAPGLVSVQILGSDGFPVTALDDTEVVLTSSKTDVATVATLVTIQRGSYFALAEYKTLEEIGETVVTAQADGFGRASAVLRVSAEADRPTKLEMSILPPIGKVDDTTERTVVVRALDDLDNPSPYPCSDTHLARDDSRVGTITTQFQLPEGVACESTAQFGTAGITPGDRGVDGQIFASADGVLPGSVDVTSIGPVPDALQADFAFSTMTLDGVPSNYLIVQLEDALGRPANTSDDITVFLDRGELDVAPSSIMSAGTGSIVLPVSADSGEASFNVLASSPNLTDANASVGITQVALDVEVDAIPDTIRMGQQADLLARVTINGQPVPGVPIKWMPENGLIALAEEITDDEGRAAATLTPQAPGQSNVLVQALMSEQPVGGFTSVVNILPPSTEQRPGPSIPIAGRDVPIAVVAGVLGGVLVLYGLYSYRERLFPWLEPQIQALRRRIIELKDRLMASISSRSDDSPPEPEDDSNTG